jgi:hypothetical protein
LNRLHRFRLWFVRNVFPIFLGMISLSVILYFVHLQRTAAQTNTELLSRSSISFAAQKNPDMDLSIVYPNTIAYEAAEPALMVITMTCPQCQTGDSRQFLLDGRDLFFCSQDVANNKTWQTACLIKINTQIPSANVYLISNRGLREEDRKFSLVFVAPTSQNQSSDNTPKIDMMIEGALTAARRNTTKLVTTNLAVPIAILVATTGWIIQLSIENGKRRKEDYRQKLTEIKELFDIHPVMFLKSAIEAFLEQGWPGELKKDLGEFCNRSLTCEKVIGIISDAYRGNPDQGVELHKKYLVLCEKDPHQNCLACLKNETMKKRLKAFFPPSLNSSEPLGVEQRWQAAIDLYDDQNFGVFARDLIIYYLLMTWEENPEAIEDLFRTRLAAEPVYLLFDSRLAGLKKVVLQDTSLRLKYDGNYPWMLPFIEIKERNRIRSDDESFSNWLEHHEFSINPFSDFRSPYENPSKLLTRSWRWPSSSPGRSEAPNKPDRHSLVTGANLWDIGAASYYFAHDLSGNNQINQASFIVTAPPWAFSAGQGAEPEMFILRSLADGWLNYIFFTPALFYNLSHADQLCLAKLFCTAAGSMVEFNVWFERKKWIILTLRRTQLESAKVDKTELDEQVTKINRDSERLLTRLVKLIGQIPPSADQRELSFDSINMKLWLSLRPLDFHRTLLIFNPPVNAGCGQSTLKLSEANWLTGLLEHASYFEQYHLLLKGFSLSGGDFSSFPIEQVTLEWNNDQLLDSLNSRLRTASEQRVSSLDDLFPQPPKAGKALVAKAQKSMGRMVCLGQQLLSKAAASPPAKIPDPTLLDQLDEIHYLDPALLDQLDENQCP